MKGSLLTLFTIFLTFNSFSQVADRLYKPNNTLVDTNNVGIVTVTTNPAGTQQPSMYSVNKNLLKWNTSQVRGLSDTIMGRLKWNNITGKPTFATVATTGDYNNLINQPNLSLYYLASNPSGYISNINSSMVIGALGYTPYNGTVNPIGFITSETDPTVPSYAKSLNAFSVIKASTDPLYKSVSYTPTNSEVITAIGYTPYNGATNPNGYITGYTETDPIYSASSWFSTTNNSTNWNTAFGWGNHSSQGYENTANKATSFSTLNNTLYPTTQAVANYVVGLGYLTSSSGTPSTRTITINGVNQDLSANRTWSVGDLLSTGSYSNPTWITSLDWGKIIGTPTTLAGYGITDGVTASALTSSLATKESSITAGTTSQYWRGDKTWQTLDKTAVGLSNVDNTSDLSKPISIATQTALNGKQDVLVSGTNIKTVGGVSILGSGNISVGTGTVTSIGITGSDFSISGSPVTTSGNITLSLANSGVSAGTYNGSYTVNAKGLITSASNVTINSNVARSLSNAAGSTNQFTISATRNARVYYSVNVSWTITALVSTSSTILLEYSTDGGSNWIIANQVSKTVNLGLVQSGNDDLNVSGEIPANSLVRIRPSVATSATITYVRGQEVLY